MTSISEREVELVVAACRAIPVTQAEYVQDDFLTNVFLTVLDLQMHNVAVDNSIRHYWDHRWDELRTLEDLDSLLAEHPNDKEGNRQVAQYLWGNNHWKRVEWLRGLVAFLAKENLTSQEQLRSWALAGDYHRDFEGQVKYLGIAAYKWLTMRLGVDTVKPDVHLRRFVEHIISRPIPDADLIAMVEGVARRLDLSPRRLDWSLWEHQRGAAGAI